MIPPFRQWTLGAALLVGAAGAAAQQPSLTNENPASAHLQFFYTAVKNNILRGAEKMPEEHYAFKPAPDVRSFGQLVAHIADGQFFLCSAVGKQPNPNGANLGPGDLSQAIEQGKSTKAHLTTALKDSFAFCDPIIGALADPVLKEPVKVLGRDRQKAGPATLMLIHLWEHYGNMVTYLRIKGLVPPSSEPAPAQPPQPAPAKQPPVPQPAAHSQSSLQGQPASQPAEKKEAPGGRVEAMPPGWRMRLDSGAVHTSNEHAEEGLKFWTMPPGWHITSGPAAIYYDPAQAAGGEFRLESQTFLFPPGERREGYGFFFGGKNLERENLFYTYFLVRRDGRFLIRQRDGAATKDLVPWTEHPAIVPWTSGTSKNELAIETNGASVDFIVNGQKVNSLPRSAAPTDGLVGLRVNHYVNIHITYLSIKPRGAAARAIEHTVTVAAPLGHVWKAWTTQEGVTSFFGPEAKLELTPGGPYEIIFDVNEKNQGCAGCTVIAFEPMKRLSFTWNAPPHLRNVRRQFSRVTLEFAPAGASSTRVRMVHDDWGAGEEWDQAFAYFQRAWPAVLGNLQYRFAQGPVQWKDGKFTVAQP